MLTLLPNQTNGGQLYQQFLATRLEDTELNDLLQNSFLDDDLNNEMVIEELRLLSEQHTEFQFDVLVESQDGYFFHYEHEQTVYKLCIQSGRVKKFVPEIKFVEVKILLDNNR